MTSTHEPHRDDLREYLRVVRSRKWEIVLIAIVVIGATVFFTLRQTPIYQATAEVLVQPVQNPLSVVAPPAPDMNTEQQLVTSQAVADEVLKDSTIPIPLSQLTRNLSVTVVTDTEVLQINYSSPDPATASSLANAFAAAYIKFRTQQAVDRLQATADTVKRQIAGVQKQFKDLTGQIAKTTDPTVLSALVSQRTSLIGRLGVLQQEYSTLQPGASVQATASVIVQRATPPTSPASPNKTRNGALALVAGLALGLGFAFLRERLDDRIKTREELERRLEAPVLAMVPKVQQWKHEQDARLVMHLEPRSPVAEAYRTLSTNLQYVASRQQLKVLMVTSAAGDEGKTTTAANLAVALAQAGKQVIVASADMRKPRLHRFFELPNTTGLSDLLSGRARLADVALDTGVQGLKVIPGGPVPQNPAALLGSALATRALEQMSALADFVILDAPPTLAVSDASVLAPRADGTLFVLDASRAGRAVVQQARVQLHNAGAQIVGAVFNNFDRSKSGAYQYSYYTYYYEYPDSDADSPNGSPAGGRRQRPGRPAARPARPTGEHGFEADRPSVAIATPEPTASPPPEHRSASRDQQRPQAQQAPTAQRPSGQQKPSAQVDQETSFDPLGLQEFFEPMWAHEPLTPARPPRRDPIVQHTPPPNGSAPAPSDPAGNGHAATQPQVKSPPESDEESWTGRPGGPPTN